MCQIWVVKSERANVCAGFAYFFTVSTCLDKYKNSHPKRNRIAISQSDKKLLRQIILDFINNIAPGPAENAYSNRVSKSGIDGKAGYAVSLIEIAIPPFNSVKRVSVVCL
jgi:hypothetical protein